MLETSNLMQYSANKISLLLRGVEAIIDEERAAVLARQDMLNGDDISDDFIARQNIALDKHERNLDDLRVMRVALLTHLDKITKQEKTLQR